MGKRRTKKRLDLLTSDQAAAPQEVPRKRGRPRKVIAVKEKADQEGDNIPDETGDEQQQQQQEHQQEEASSSRDAGKDEEKAIQEQNQEDEKPSSSRGRRKSRKPLKST
ncbi:rho GTPase-activating protein gacV-like [Dioscorea cayenensis subsp. rotundata]|uniref:Rho GTPase-activating protein gacV-like n=1 Tax=Dioscorea cayennensis subsp. rotundata TaxID=55577 RepID=A0AB40BWL1_DIOCR|nr:rho GTPase-activating protein gacV-like [Dioscorea cayenensis subsp. rotundata]